MKSHINNRRQQYGSQDPIPFHLVASSARSRGRGKGGREATRVSPLIEASNHRRSIFRDLVGVGGGVGARSLGAVEGCSGGRGRVGVKRRGGERVGLKIKGGYV